MIPLPTRRTVARLDDARCRFVKTDVSPMWRRPRPPRGVRQVHDEATQEPFHPNVQISTDRARWTRRAGADGAQHSSAQVSEQHGRCDGEPAPRMDRPRTGELLLPKTKQLADADIPRRHRLHAVIKYPGHLRYTVCRDRISSPRCTEASEHRCFGTVRNLDGFLGGER